jgi:hypothetical protein
MSEMVLQEGMTNALEGRSFVEPNDKGEKANHAFLTAVEQVVNTHIFGAPDNPGQWQCPASDDRTEVGPIKFTNVRARKVMKKLEDLVDICVVDVDRRADWTKTLVYYRLLLSFLLSHVDLSPSQVFAFQKNCDIYGHYWLKLYGKDGETNYIHFLRRGHFAEYLTRWGNLYQHSQQGWEAFNGLLKTFYFRRTQRGGHNKGKKSKLRPVACWLQRRMVWKSGEATYEEMCEEHNNATNRSESDTSDDDDESLPSLLNTTDTGEQLLDDANDTVEEHAVDDDDGYFFV